MAKNVTAQVLGGTPKVIEAETVRDAYKELALDGSYTPTVNGEPAEMDDDLNDYEFVNFAPAVKGGC